MNKMKVLSVMMLMALLSTSCLNTEEDRYLPLPASFFVNMYEELHSDYRVFYLIIETEQKYDCDNYMIDYRWEMAADSTIAITLQQIYKPNFCYTSKGPARAIFAFSQSWDEVKLRFNAMGNKVEARLNKDTVSYTLSMEDTETFKKRREQLMRVPANTIWGILEYNSLEMEAYADSFYIDLDTLGADSIFMEDGDYGYFEIENGAIVDPGAPNSRYSQVFIRYYDNYFYKVENLANRWWYRSAGLKSTILSDKADYYTVGNLNPND